MCRGASSSRISEGSSIFHTPDGAPFVICNSENSFLNPTTQPGITPEEINGQLNLDLGQKVLTRKNTVILWIVNFLDILLIRWWENAFFYIWGELVPFSFRRYLALGAWKVFVGVHKAIIGKRSGLHPSQSFEYHALTTIMWGARFIAVTPRRMRFSLSQLHVIAPNFPPSDDRVTRIEVQPDFLRADCMSKEFQDSSSVKGWHIYCKGKSQPSSNVIFWIYGGAYLAGDIRGNSAAADWMGSRCQVDVFIPNIRLAPESNLDEVLWDVCVAYKWLSSRFEKPSDQITVLGISSGGALATRLMQLIGQYSRGEDIGVPDYFFPLLDGMTMPAAGVLFAPYVDYDVEKKGSFLHYPRHDLIVTESVQQYGLPYLENFIPKRPGVGDPRREYSPINRSMVGLPPLCVIVSEHEAVYDMTIDLVNRARSDGVKTTVTVFKYMCHVFSFLHGFIPEGRISMELVADWIVELCRYGN
jgi:acetyl esterase/lipase